MTAGVIALVVLAVFVFLVAATGVRIVPQARAGIVERLGRFQRTLDPGLALIVPFVDRVKPLIDLREQVVSFPPQPVITEDNLVVGIDTVIYFTVTDPKAATYEVANPLQAIEQLTVTTLRNVIGGLTLEETLTCRDQINSQLRVVLDEATGRWGIRVNRVELKSVEPPAHGAGGDGEADARRARPPRRDPHRRGRQAVADPHRRGREAGRGARPPRAPGPRRSCAPRASPRRSRPSSGAIHEGAPDQELLSYQYLQMLPELAQGDANKIFVIPTEFSPALGQPRRRAGRPRALRRPAEAAPEAVAASATRSTPGPPPTPRRPRRPRAAPPRRPRRRRPGTHLRRAARPRSAGRGRAADGAGVAATTSPRRVFDSLSEKLQGTLAGVRQRGALTEDDIDEAMREIRLALLEADVNFQVVKDFTKTVKERCARRRGARGSSTPASRSSRSSTRSCTALMGGASAGLTFASRPPTVILMAGLQGSGKTTATGKLARWLREQHGSSVARRRLRRLPPGGRRAARQGRRPGRRDGLRAGHRPRPGRHRPLGAATRPSATARTS